MQTTTLIHTIGNSDLQFSSFIAAGIAGKYLEKNNNNPEYLVPKAPFKETTAALWELIRGTSPDGIALKGMMTFPLIEADCNFILSEEKTIDKLLIIGTHQTPMHDKDTLYLCKIIEYVYKQHFQSRVKTVETVLFTQNLKDTKAETYIYDTVLRILNQEEASKLFLSINSGVPAVSTAFRVAGFRRAYRYIEPLVQKDGTTKCIEVSNQSMYQTIEKRIQQI